MAPKIGYRIKYNIRKCQPTKNSLEVTFPYQVVEREARLRGLTVVEFRKQFVAVAEFNGFRGVQYTFAERDSNETAEIGS